MASNVSHLQEHDTSHGSSKVQVTILASEWGSSKGGLSTINRELAIQLAKFSGLEVTFFFPKCSDEDKKAADSHGISIVEAVRQPGYNELDWLSFPPGHLTIDVIVGHGVKLGRQAQVIRNSHKCKWVQVVHTDPEELGMFKGYENPISMGEEKHHVEVELCEIADFVVGVGPKLAEAFRKYLGFCKKHQDIFEFTPGIFDEFSSVQQVPDERKECSVLVFGRGDAEDFKLKGFDIAARSVAALSDTILVFVGAPHGKHEEIAKSFIRFGIPADRLRVRSYVGRESLKKLFCEVDVVLMPSRTEGFGLTGLEALSAGLPVLVSKNSGFGEALGSVPCGSLFVIGHEDPSAWAAAIECIWNKDRKSRLDEVKTVRDFYAERYSWSEQCKHLMEKMVELVDGSSSELTAQAVEARKQKDYCPRVPPETTTGRIEKNESEQPAARASCPSHVIEGIRQVYQKCEGMIVPIPWCDEFSFQIENIFTRLKIVEKEKTRGITTTKEVTNMTGIFTPHKGCKQPLIVLIEGEPGMGKTTYSQKLVFDWASKQCRDWYETFPRIDVLLFLRCRGIKSTIWDAIEDQILPVEIKPEEKEMFFQFLKENPSKVLLVLDGLDEADQQKLEMYLNLIHKKQLPGCYIVLTSRHEAGRNLRPYTDTLLEIVGFTRADAECFIRKYFQHEQHLAEKLISKVFPRVHTYEDAYRDLGKLLKNPLNTLLLCVIFEDLEGILPTNRTQLYVEIVLFILRRYESKNGLSNRDKDLLLVYKKELMMLGESALNSLRKQELYFDDHKGDIKESLSMKFGFLSIQSGGSKRAPCDRYGFFHKSFQEFFSGYFLAFSAIDNVTNSHSVLTDERYVNELSHVLKFMSGILAQRSEEAVVSIVESIASIVSETGLTSPEVDFYLSVANILIRECKTCSRDLYTKIVRTLGETLRMVDVVVRSTSFPWNSEFTETFFHALAFNSTVSSLILTECSFIDLLSQALRVNTSLSSLDLARNSIGNEGANSLAQALRVNTSLSSLALAFNSIGNEGANSLAQALRVNTSLSSLKLTWNSIGYEGANSLAQALRLNTSLSSLDLSWNSIGYEGTNSLAQALRVNTSLSSLDLTDSSIDYEGANSLAQALRVNTSLSSLDLSWNSIGNEGANSLAQALRVNTSLSSLDLADNSIGNEGANSLAQALRVNTSLSSLDLADNSIGNEGANSLAQALRVNTSLSSLDLTDSSICNEGANSLVQALRVNTSLSSLDLSWNSIGNEGANSLAQALRVNTSLSSLDLADNSIGNEGANSLAQALRVNTSLSSLDLTDSSIDNEGANSLAQALRVNTSLSSLDLCWNYIGNEGANSLAQALRLNTSLSSLDLADNSIGNEGANSLAQALRVNTSLSSLRLARNNIGNEGANSLVLRVNTSLSSRVKCEYGGQSV
ncbi:protein NLRC3-like [Acropora muricata]|uniref:protein NLRC3-like n=1 Tax=Acropora muricata TaxID=159855 RepID=UPI0034E61C00